MFEGFYSPDPGSFLVGLLFSSRQKGGKWRAASSFDLFSRDCHHVLVLRMSTDFPRRLSY